MCAKGNILRNFLTGKEIAGEALSADIVLPKNEAYSRMGARALSAGRGANGVGGSANGEDDEILSELMVGVTLSLSSLSLLCSLALCPLSFLSLSLCFCVNMKTNKRTGEGKGFRRKGADP